MKALLPSLLWMIVSALPVVARSAESPTDPAALIEASRQTFLLKGARIDYRFDLVSAIRFQTAAASGQSDPHRYQRRLHAAGAL